ncbi:CdaR family transcriptional regulator [Neobacillus sp. SM06]|uniref:CdaR family transcriptional regulator n=1 Tax=Neobacillus sp. SM06 TaxID=3422492 RepID=UPI003D27AB2C
MDYLNHQLAQEIVDRTMQIIKRNINVMNEKGVIIGSGDRSRIDSIHEGALKVIEGQTGFEINEMEAEELHGVKKGINLPIMLHGKIVGVIGITGNPDDVSSFGELVKMTAEMIIQQAVLMEELQWDKRLKEELVSQLLHQPAQLDTFFYERINRLGINLETPRVPILFIAEDRLYFFKKVTERLEPHDLYVMEQEQLVILKPVFSKIDTIVNWIDSLLNSGIPFKVSVGSICNTVKGLSESYADAKITLMVGKTLHPEKNIYRFDDYHIPVFLAKSAQNGTPKVGKYYHQLKQSDGKNGELIETLLAYIEENGDIQATTQRLFIHRNTLRYRLERIAAITGKNPQKLKDLLELYLSILQEKVHCADA